MDDRQPDLRLEELIRILDTMKVGIIITDREGTVLWGNRYYSDLAKFPISDYFGRHVREISQRENVILPEHKTLFDTVLQKNAEIHEVVKYNTDDYVISTVAPVMDESGQPAFSLYTITNYSETLRMQKELSLSYARSSALEEQLLELQFRRQLGDEVVVKDRAMKHLFQMGARLAFVPASVVILGESGVGKDVLAKFIHRSGSRKDQPFIHVNLGAIPKELFVLLPFVLVPATCSSGICTRPSGTSE